MGNGWSPLGVPSNPEKKAPTQTKSFHLVKAPGKNEHISSSDEFHLDPTREKQKNDHLRGRKRKDEPPILKKSSTPEARSRLHDQSHLRLNAPAQVLTQNLQRQFLARAKDAKPRPSPKRVSSRSSRFERLE